MKKILLALSIFPLPFSLCHSQITITNSDMPSAGDTLRISYTNDTIDPAITGPNHTWNYGFLQATSQWVEKFDSPSTFTTPFNLLFNPINTSYGQQQYTPDSVPGLGITLDNAYGFFKKSSSNLKQVGLGLSLNSLPIPFDYNPDDYVYNFPLNYGDVDSCDSEFGPPGIIPLPFYYGQKIHRVNVVDGWGTLTTPFGTFQALRVKCTLAIRDTLADSSGLGFSFPRPLQYEYQWLKAGGKIPYLQINASDIAGNPVVTQISYRDSMRAGVIQIGIKENVNSDFAMQLFPNPASDYAFLQYKLNNSLDVKIELLDMNGKSISTIRNAKQTAGPHMEVINLRNLNLSKGTYFVSLGAGKEVKKLIIK